MKNILIALALLATSPAFAQDLATPSLLADETTWQVSRTGKMLVISNNDSVAALILRYGKQHNCLLQYSYKVRRKFFSKETYPQYVIYLPLAAKKELETIL